MSFSQHPAPHFSATYVITILKCIWCHIKANATTGSVTVHSAWEEDLQEWKAFSGIS